MVRPSTIHCLALNYSGVGPSDNEEPLYFIKGSEAYATSGVIISYPKNVSRFWTEVELGIVISEDCQNITEDEAIKYVEGFVVCGDISCSNIYSRDHHLAFSKSRKSFCPTSKLSKNKFIETNNLNMITEINGKVTQKGSTSSMILNVSKSLSYISNITELKKSDIIITGTPKGWQNNFLKSGDKITHKIERIGEVEFHVK